MVVPQHLCGKLVIVIILSVMLSSSGVLAQTRSQTRSKQVGFMTMTETASRSHNVDYYGASMSPTQSKTIAFGQWTETLTLTVTRNNNKQRITKTRTRSAKMYGDVTQTTTVSPTNDVTRTTTTTAAHWGAQWTPSTTTTMTQQSMFTLTPPHAAAFQTTTWTQTRTLQEEIHSITKTIVVARRNNTKHSRSVTKTVVAAHNNNNTMYSRTITASMKPNVVIAVVVIILRLSGNDWATVLNTSYTSIVRSVQQDMAAALVVPISAVIIYQLSVGSLVVNASVNASSLPAVASVQEMNALVNVSLAYANYSAVTSVYRSVDPNGTIGFLSSSVTSTPATSPAAAAPTTSKDCDSLCIGLSAGLGGAALVALVIVIVRCCTSSSTKKDAEAPTGSVLMQPQSMEQINQEPGGALYFPQHQQPQPRSDLFEDML